MNYTYHIPSSVRFSAPKLYINALTAVVYIFLTQTTPTHYQACNSHGTQLATARPVWDKGFLAGNGRQWRREDCFLNPFVHRRTAVACPEPTKAFLKQSPETAMLSAPFGCTHPPPPLSAPFCWSRTHLQRSLTSQHERFMPDISGYIQERVNAFSVSISMCSTCLGFSLE